MEPPLEKRKGDNVFLRIRTSLWSLHSRSGLVVDISDARIENRDCPEVGLLVGTVERRIDMHTGEKTWLLAGGQGPGHFIDGSGF